MNTIPSAPDIRDYVATHLGEVFETMLSLKAEPGPEWDVKSLAEEHVSGSVGLAGEAVTGSVYLHISSAFARQAAAAMLGLTPEELNGLSDINDVVAEITNMLGGGLKSRLCDAGATCVLTTPAVIRGTSFGVSAKPGVQMILLGFTCEGYPGQVEVHIRFQ